MEIKNNIRKSVTLIELVVVMTIVGILAAGLAGYINQTISVWDFLSSRSDVVNYGRLSLVRMANDIRWIANNTSITTANNATLVFNNITGSAINYTWNGNRLIYNSNTLSIGVSDFKFTYFNNSGSLIPSPVSGANLTNIYRVGINATFSQKSVQGNKAVNETSTVTTEVHPRNF